MLSTSSLSIADGYLIVNILLSWRRKRGRGETGLVFAVAWLICDGISLSWWENRKLDGRCPRLAGAETEWMLRMNINTVAISSLWLHSYSNSWSHSFSSRKRTTCGASYKWQIPTRPPPLISLLGWPTYAYFGTWICSGWSVFVFVMLGTYSITAGKRTKEVKQQQRWQKKQKPVSPAL